MKLLDSLFIVESAIDDGDSYQVQLKMNPKHFIYDAHFPGNPITPGVCIVQTAGELLQRELKRDIYLQTVKNVKFLSLLIPAEDKSFSYSFSSIKETSTELCAKVVVSDEMQIFAKMSLVYSYEPL